MTKSISTRTLNFAGGEGHAAAYNQFLDYWNHYQSMHNKNKVYDFQRNRSDGTTITFDEKETLMNESLKKEILRHANIANASCPHPPGKCYEVKLKKPGTRSRAAPVPPAGG